jgi:hypothetical protein
VSAGTSAVDLPERLQDEPVPAIAVAPTPPEDPPGVFDLGGVLGDASWLDALTWITDDLAAQGGRGSTTAGGSTCPEGSCGSALPGASLILAVFIAVIAAAALTRSLIRRSGAVLTTR